MFLAWLCCLDEVVAWMKGMLLAWLCCLDEGMLLAWLCCLDEGDVPSMVVLLG